MNYNKYQNKPFLKWPGGKYRLCNKIIPALPQEKILVEPFVGAGSIFLNSDFEKYILYDINEDLIKLYNSLKTNKKIIIEGAQKLFTPKNNSSKAYYRLRNKFNKSKCPIERSIIFIYLNKHGYNGLCRYNLKGGYNVPFGSYSKVSFPKEEIIFFAKKAKKANFICAPFQEAFKNLPPKAIVYCDPPYVPLSDTANFTSYAKHKFDLEQQLELAKLSKKAAKKGNKVILSNHNTSIVKGMYQGANFKQFKVKRSISCKAQQRKSVSELLAIFTS